MYVWHRHTSLFMLLCVHVYVMVCSGVRARNAYGDQVLQSSIFLNKSQLYLFLFVDTKPRPTPGVHQCAKVSWVESSRCLSAFQHWLQMCANTLGFIQGFWGSDLGCCACMARQALYLLRHITSLQL